MASETKKKATKCRHTSSNIESEDARETRLLLECNVHDERHEAPVHDGLNDLEHLRRRLLPQLLTRHRFFVFFRATKCCGANWWHLRTNQRHSGQDTGAPNHMLCTDSEHLVHFVEQKS